MFIICPVCATHLIALDSSWPEETLKVCSGCNAQYAKKKGVLRFVSGHQYADSFGFEWKMHEKTYATAKERAATMATLHKSGLTEETVRDKKILDIGCGTGRFSQVLATWGAAVVVAVDLSYAIDIAYANLQESKNVIFVQADMMALPFEPETFDIILAWGVLHHTPDTRQAFMQVLTHLKPGGDYYVYIYGTTKQLRRKMITLYRHFTPSIPNKILYKLCLLAGPLYYVYKIPLIGTLLKILLPISHQPDIKIRILETFDEYSPKYAWRHSFPDVFDWFVQAGMNPIRIYNPPIYASGHLPERASTSASHG